MARLPRNAGDTATSHEINRNFTTARSLHANFYENELPEDVILEGLMDCEELSALLFALFWPAGAAAAVAAEQC